MRHPYHPAVPLASLLILLGGWQAASLANVYPPGTVRYAGRATVLRANANLATSTTKVLLADTGELDSAGGTKETTVVTFDNPAPLEAHSQTAHARTSGADSVGSSTAAVEQLLVNVGSLRVTADVIKADSSATCDLQTGAVGVSGTSTIVNLKINGNPIDGSRPPNTSVTVPGVATVIINEQIQPDVNSIVVNALHIIVPGAAGVAKADIVISHAESGILTCTSYNAVEEPPVEEPPVEEPPVEEPPVEEPPVEEPPVEEPPAEEPPAEEPPPSQCPAAPQSEAVPGTPPPQQGSAAPPPNDGAAASEPTGQGSGAIGSGLLLLLAGAMLGRARRCKL